MIQTNIYSGPFVLGSLQGTHAPTLRLAHLMRSPDARDRLVAAQEARSYWNIPRIQGTWLHVTTRSGDGASGDAREGGMIVLFAEAFSTWGWLGSTIEHEYSHQADDFDYSDLGNAQSEIKAYSQQLQHVEKFGNSPSEKADIKRGLEHYQSLYEHLRGDADW